jgi:hypothetical protein
MSDTPRTDAAECEAHIGILHFRHQDMCDAYKFYRQLERELNAANRKIELLMSANADVARIAAERDAAEKRVLHLEAALRKIADQDYRGPRSTESEIALRALEDKP